MIKRFANLSKTNSFFLLGARGSGKTTLLEKVFSPEDSLYVDLLDLTTFDELILDKSRFQALIDAPEHCSTCSDTKA